MENHIYKMIEKIDKQLDKHDEKFDKIEQRLDSIDSTLERNTASLVHHVRRTDLLEENIEKFRKELKPLEQHVNYMHGSLKFLCLLSICMSIILTVFKFF